MTGKEMIKLNRRNGWSFIKAAGSHYKLKKGEEIEIMPFHTKELKKGIQEYLLRRLKEVG